MVGQLGAVCRNNGYLPLHYSCSDSNISLDVVKLLIENGIQNKIGINTGSNRYCGGLLVKDAHGDTPIKIIFRRVLFTKSSSSSGESNNSNDSGQHSLLWQKLCLVVKATCLAMRGLSYSDDTLSETPLLHAIIECGGHTSLVKYALRLHPGQALTRDENGRVPLTIASTKVDTNPEIIELLLLEENQDGVEAFESSSATKNDSSTSRQKMQSAAAMCDGEGRLPLHLAVQSGRTLNNGVNWIVNAAPLALQTRDVHTRMYPFMLAAIPTYKWDNTCVDTIYTLLRKAPHVVQKYCKYK